MVVVYIEVIDGAREQKKHQGSDRCRSEVAVEHGLVSKKLVELDHHVSLFPFSIFPLTLRSVTTTTTNNTNNNNNLTTNPNPKEQMS